jgi:hypothetical protein
MTLNAPYGLTPPDRIFTANSSSEGVAKLRGSASIGLVFPMIHSRQKHHPLITMKEFG